MTTSPPPRPGFVTACARRGHRWRPALLCAVLLASAGGLARMHTASPPEPTSSTGAPSPGSDVQAQVLALLESPRNASTPEAEWRRLGPAAVPVLSGLVLNPSEPPARRTRAVSSLALVDPTGAAVPLRTVLEDAKAPAEVRASAAGALGLCLGLDAIPTLISRLQDRESEVREAVAVALGRLGGKEARQALEDRLPMEERAPVREALQRGLTLVEP